MSENENDWEAGHRGNSLLRIAGIKQEWTVEQVEEYIKCSNDPIYFTETYVKIISEDGFVPFVLRDYQKEMVSTVFENRFVLIGTSRQAGKCCSSFTKIRVRNKKTREVQELTIGEFLEVRSQIKRTASQKGKGCLHKYSTETERVSNHNEHTNSLQELSGSFQSDA